MRKHFVSIFAATTSSVRPQPPAGGEAALSGTRFPAARWRPLSFEQQLLAGHSSSPIKSSVPAEAPRGTEAAFPAPGLELESSPDSLTLTADDQPSLAVFCALCTHRGSGSDLPFRLTANRAGDSGFSSHQPAYFGRGKNAFYKTFIKNLSSAQGGNLGSFTPETWIKEAARVQLTPSPSFGAAPALHGQTAKPPRLVSPGPRAADGAAGGARSRGGPVSPSDGTSSGRIFPARAAAQPAARGSRARGAGDAHGGSGAGRDLGSSPRRSSEPLDASGTWDPGAPREAGRRRGESGAVSVPQRRFRCIAGQRRGGPGNRAAAQRPLRRAKGFRPTWLGPAGRNCTRSSHAATHGRAPPPARLPRPDPEPPAAAGTGRGGPGEGARAAHSSSVAGPRAQTCGRPGPSPAEDPSGKLRDWGSPTGRGGRSLPGLRAQQRCCFPSAS